MIINDMKGMGWIPDYPDHRDFTPESLNSENKRHKGILELMKKLHQHHDDEEKKSNRPKTKIDLREYCSPIEDQKSLGSCTANAGVALLEYFERKAFGTHIDASRLFLYKVTRNLLGWTGDTGAYLRTTMAAMVLFGIPPSKYYRYEISNFDVEPDAFTYGFAGNYKSINYLRLDSNGMMRKELIARIKKYLKGGFPSMFGFTVYNSISQARSNGEIPYPCQDDQRSGGHAIVAIGYDDEKKIKNRYCNEQTTGAFIIRNSWGSDWGDNGYGYLPYKYVENWLAVDWWTLINSSWVDTEKFDLAR